MEILSVIFISLMSGLAVILCEDETPIVKTLCEKPIIHSADRLSNNTVRVYRDQYYWELIGLPAESVQVNGPFRIWYLNMGSFSTNNAMVTVLEGTDSGSTYKFDGQRYWAWDKDGMQFAGAAKGNYWNLIPEGGFEAAFHDGSKTDPTVVGFKGIKVYYFSTKSKVWTGDKSGHLNGKFNENFPPDLTAAFSWPADDPKDGYIAYLFKRKQFCKRTKILKSQQNCDKWVDNRVLFSCPANTFNLPDETDAEETSDTGPAKPFQSPKEPKSDDSAPQPSDPVVDKESPTVTRGSDSSQANVCSLSLAFICLSICLNFISILL